MDNKILLVIADGLGDRPCKDLGYRTPLEYAETKHLDFLAQTGCTGIMDLHRCGTPVGTDLGHMILFGYSLEDYPGRGPIEAFGEGVELQAGDVAFRCNFATVDDDMTVIDRRAGRIREGAAELAKSINGIVVDGVQVLFKEATEHRAVMVLRGVGLSANVTDTDPKIEGVKVKKPTAKDESKEAEYTAQILEKVLAKTHEILISHPVNKERIKEGRFPANALLTRGAGMMPSIEKITERLSFKACCVASERTVLGAARLAGFSVYTEDGFTGNIDTDEVGKANAAVNALAENDFVVLHYKATDLMGHDNNPRGKVCAIEKYDRMVGLVLDTLNSRHMENVIVALAADHSTPCERREHSGEPVPIAVWGKSIRRDHVLAYDEISCSTGGLGRLKGCEFNSMLLDYIEVSPKQGN